MAGREERETFAAVLRELPGPGETVSEEFVPLDPEGFPMPSPRRMTIKQARPWIKREQIPLGIWPCAPAIQWVPAADRVTFAAQLRRMEGKDCDLRGDALLFTITRGRHAVVLHRL